MKTLWKKEKNAENEQFHLFRNGYHAIFILRSFNSQISVVVCSVFELGWSQNVVLGNG